MILQQKPRNALQSLSMFILLFAIVILIIIVILPPLFFFPLLLAVYNVGLILAEAPSYSFRTSC